MRKKIFFLRFGEKKFKNKNFTAKKRNVNIDKN